jgi:beta-1,4-N-acetylglucosaminyltransferase
MTVDRGAWEEALFIFCAESEVASCPAYSLQDLDKPISSEMLPLLPRLSTFQAAVITTLILAAWSTLLVAARLIAILQPLRGRPPPRKRGDPAHLLVVLGSGGHTAEMLAMLRTLDTAVYVRRTYVVSEGDPVSAQRARALEAEFSDRSASTPSPSPYDIWTVPRARKVHQSILTTPISCLRTLRAVLRLLRATSDAAAPAPREPDIILANGPATSAIVIFASLMLRFADLSSKGHARTRIVFIESFARVRTLSLSAKCVGWFVDRLVVQWKGLSGGPLWRTEYAGPLVVSSLI